MEPATSRSGVIVALALFGLAVLGTLFIHGASGSLLSFALRDTSVFVRIFDVFVLAVALATFFDTSHGHLCYLLFTTL
jgi:hypothetical protein